MAECQQCGNENPPQSRYCTNCGSSMSDERAAQQPHQVTASHSEAPAQAGYTPPSLRAAPPPAQAQGAPVYPAPQQPPGYEIPPTAPPAGYRTQMLQAKRRTKGPLFWVGAGIVFVSGVLVLVSTWLAWATGPGGFFSLSGWDWYNLGKAGSDFAGQGNISNAFFVYSRGYPFFTGLCSLILGGAIVFFVLLMLSLRMKGFAVMTLILSAIALGLAIADLTTILRTANIGPAVSGSLGVGIGIYILLIFSALGLGGSIGALAG